VRPDITVAQLAQISVAYETLRDPVRRRAYDASLGLGSEPKEPTPPPVAAEPRVASFIAASLREPAKPVEAESHPRPDPLPTQPAPKREAAARPRVDLVPELSIERERIPIDRRQATLGAGVAGLAILALALALPHKQAAQAPAAAVSSLAAPAHTVTVGLPPATPAPEQAAPPQAPAPATADARPVPAPVAEIAAPAFETPPAASSDQAQGGDQAAAQSSEEAAAQSPAEAAADGSAVSAAATAPAASSAKLPLSNATIAQTIGRIGYACGTVVSSSPVDGAASGVFKITCSSGDSYQASPVNGRYHFRRWGSH
jgi:hypothetical protein